jgi:hypothetical protein
MTIAPYICLQIERCQRQALRVQQLLQVGEPAQRTASPLCVYANIMQLNDYGKTTELSLPLLFASFKSVTVLSDED